MNKRIRWLILLVLLLIPFSASAASAGSLLIQEIEEPVCLYQVSDASGSFAGEFKNCSLSPVFNDWDKDARKLQTYAQQNQISGRALTPQQGEAFYDSLEEGLYLVCSLAQPGEFSPFLMAIPMELDGKPIYHVKAKPKLDDAPPETEGTYPSEKPSDTRIPQTGTSVIPQYALLVLGTLTTLAGLYQVVSEKEEDACD